MRRVAFLLISVYIAFDIIASPLDVLLANIALHGVALGTPQPTKLGGIFFGSAGAIPGFSRPHETSFSGKIH